MPVKRVSTYLDINVYEAALDRVRFVYDECDDVIVAMSGGKDVALAPRDHDGRRHRLPCVQVGAKLCEHRGAIRVRLRG